MRSQRLLQALPNRDAAAGKRAVGSEPPRCAVYCVAAMVPQSVRDALWTEAEQRADG